IGHASRRSEKARFVWLHARGMYGAWYAPLDLQRSLFDDDDPPPADSSKPPDFEFRRTSDPDVIFQNTCAYAAQVMMLDACWDSFLESINSEGKDQWLIALIGARGFPLGEHGRIGGVDPRMYAEQLHVPWIIQFPDNVGWLARASALTMHSDL